MALVHHDVAASAVVPNSHERLFAGRVCGQLDRVIGVFHWLPVDAFNHVTGLQSGFGRGGTGFHLRHDGAVNGVWNVELRAGLRIQIAHADTVERAGVVPVLRAGVGHRAGAGQLFDGDFEGLAVAVAQNFDRRF